MINFRWLLALWKYVCCTDGLVVLQYAFLLDYRLITQKSNTFSPSSLCSPVLRNKTGYCWNTPGIPTERASLQRWCRRFWRQHRDKRDNEPLIRHGQTLCQRRQRSNRDLQNEHTHLLYCYKLTLSVSRFFLIVAKVSLPKCSPPYWSNTPF